MWLFSELWVLTLCQRSSAAFLMSIRENRSISICSSDKVLTGDILTGLKEKKYDIGFCSKFDDEPLIEFIPVAKQDLVVIVPPEHPLAEKSEIHLEETLPYKQIIFKKRSGLRQIIDQLLRASASDPDVAF